MMLISVIDVKSIQELKSFAAPPDKVVKVCVCLLPISGKKNLGWESCKKLMTNPKKFLEKLGEFDLNSITEKQLKDVKKLVDQCGSMDPDEIKKKSKVASQIADYVTAWVEAAESY